MASYNVIISPKAVSQLDAYISYIQYTLLNDQAAKGVWADALETANELEESGGAFHLCAHPRLRASGYRLIPFRRHRYVMLYRIESSTVYVDAIYHQLQDYENIFAKETE